MVGVQSAATASASKCRERLAVAARMHRTSQRSSVDMATTPTAMHAMEPQVSSLDAQPGFSSFGSRGAALCLKEDTCLALTSRVQSHRAL